MWAKQIREIKIHELEELINSKQKIINDMLKSNDVQIMIYKHELFKLNDKLKFLKNLK